MSKDLIMEFNTRIVILISLNHKIYMIANNKEIIYTSKWMKLNMWGNMKVDADENFGALINH